MSLPPLPDWQPTKTALHRAAQVISAVREAVVDPLPNHLHHSLTPTRDGATTRDLPRLGALTVNYRTGKLVHTHNGAVLATHTLHGATQAGLWAAVADTVNEMLPGVALPSPGDLTDETLTFDPAHGAAFATVHGWAFDVIARTRAHALGFQTPLVQWAHGFDLSTLIFAQGSVEEQDPHVNLGFSPGTPGHPAPYLYIYAYPEQAALREALPAGWAWQAGWNTPGGLLAYDKLGDATGDNLTALFWAGFGALAAS